MSSSTDFKPLFDKYQSKGAVSVKYCQMIMDGNEDCLTYAPEAFFLSEKSI